MKHCPNIDMCPMFQLFSFAGTLNVWKTNYCTSSYVNCARYQQSSQALIVPDNLLPNGTLLRKRATNP